MLKSKRAKLIYLLLFYSVLIWVFYRSCTKEKLYSDGYYCANVHYYNPETEKESDYRLSILIEDSKVVKIIFPKGGWLDESHFEAPVIINGKRIIVTDDRDREFEISNLEKGKCADF